MGFNDKHISADDEYWRRALNDLVSEFNNRKQEFNEEGKRYTKGQIAKWAGVNLDVFSKATVSPIPQHKFSGFTREQLLKNIIKNSDVEIEYVSNDDGLEFRIRKKDTKFRDDMPSSDYFKVYYWRDKSVAVGFLKFSIENEEWHTATLLIGNRFENIDRDPYKLNGKVNENFRDNIFIDFIDHKDSSLRQLCILYITRTSRQDRELIEGTYTTVTQHESKPIAGLMLLQKCTHDEIKEFNIAYDLDGENNFNNQKIFLGRLFNVDSVIVNYLFKKRITIKGKRLYNLDNLPNYESWKKLIRYKGLYKGYYFRTDIKMLEVFILQLYEDSSAVIFMPGDQGYRDRYIGNYKSVPEDILTIRFVYNPDEDHFRFRFIFNGEFKNSLLYGIFAGTDTNNSPVAGRVRLDRISDNPGELHNNLSKLERIEFNINEYNILAEKDSELTKFLLGESFENYTTGSFLKRLLSDDLKTNTSFIVEAESNFEAETTDWSTEVETIYEKFPYEGQYDIYTLSRREEEGDYIYSILKYPLYISSQSGLAVLKGPNNQAFQGSANFNKPALTIQLSHVNDLIVHNNFLFKVKPLAETQVLNHTYGVCNWINPDYDRAEAAIAVLVRLKSEVNLETSNLNQFKDNEYKEYIIGEKDFFELDKDQPKLATFIAGHFNRLVSAPSKPNSPILTRHYKYRLVHFQAACFAGLKYNQFIKQGKVNFKNDCLKLLDYAFQHNFCDPDPKFLDSNAIFEDANLLIDEMLTGGTLENLVNEVIGLCLKWRRSNVIKIWNSLNNISE